MNLSKIVSPLLKWYDSHARILPWRENPEPYAVWISEIMLQQTRVEAVKPYFDRWMKAFPNLSSLANATEAEVMKLWEGLGYYSRVRNIHRTARIVLEKYGGRLPSSFEELLGLPGIGEYTAGAVGSIAFQLPVPCVDGNVLRVVTRLTAETSDITVAATKKLLTDWVREIIPEKRPGDFNQAMMELGATVCLPNGLPKCEQCPVASICEARLQNRIIEFPVKSGKPSRKIEEKTVLILLDNTKAMSNAALRKRPETGLLAGLWEFPNFEGALSEVEVRQMLKSSGLNASSLVKLKNAKHIFSHIEWHMTGYLVKTGDEKSINPESNCVAEQNSNYNLPNQNVFEYEWVSIDLLDEKLALPAAFKTYYQLMKSYINKES
ncbi:MAG TPA: A/G-specific adenine glycosylase [Anaerovoracaceae bacterium]|nr:A/G-specific adenine glycosylase [Anaerovoracaceae bacterium]